MSAPVDHAPWETGGELNGSLRPAVGLVDATAAAALLGVPRSWVLAQARAQRIPHVRLGRYVRFEPDELRAWWEGRRRGPLRKRGCSS